MTSALRWSCRHGSACWHFDILARLPGNLPVSQRVFSGLRDSDISMRISAAKNSPRILSWQVFLKIQWVWLPRSWDLGENLAVFLAPKISEILLAKNVERFSLRSRLDLSDLTGQKCGKILGEILARSSSKFCKGLTGMSCSILKTSKQFTFNSDKGKTHRRCYYVPFPWQLCHMYLKFLIKLLLITLFQSNICWYMFPWGI